MSGQSKRRTAVVATAAAGILVLWWSAAPVAKQNGQQNAPNPVIKATSDPAWTPSKTAWGHPDLQGIWNNGTYTSLERSLKLADKEFFTEEEAVAYYNDMAAADVDGRRDQLVHYDFTQYGLDKWQNGVKANLRTSVIYDPKNGRLPPMTPEAKARLSVPRPRGADIRSRGITERCITGYWGGLPMLTNSGGPGADAEHQILQTKDYVLIVSQSSNDNRIIPLDGRPHLSSRIPRWFGDARGRWDGDTLVIDTTNLGHTSFRGASPQMHLVERLTRVREDVLLYQFTIEDPATWTAPISGELPWVTSPGPMFEFACHETNYGLLNILKSQMAAAKRGGPTESRRRARTEGELPVGAR